MHEMIANANENKNTATTSKYLSYWLVWLKLKNVCSACGCAHRRAQIFENPIKKTESCDFFDQDFAILELFMNTRNTMFG